MLEWHKNITSPIQNVFEDNHVCI